MTPDSGWLPFLKMLLGFLLIVLIGVIALTIAIGHVEEKTSFGLKETLTALYVLAGMFAQWAFGGDKDNNAK